MKLLMYGAGNIGRGFIGAIFASAGYEVVFVDINEQVIDALNKDGSYTVEIAARPQPYQIKVSGVRGVNGADEQKVIDEIAGCDIMATSLGANALRYVAPIIAKGFEKRQAESGAPLDILICENLKDAAHLLKGWITAGLTHTSGVVDSKLGLIEAAIGRMVPVISASEQKDPLFVRVEEYDFLPVDRTAFRGKLPDVPQLVPHDPFVFYEERKLYLHNMSHCICAFLGQLAGYEYIWQAIADPAIAYMVQGAMTESAAMLSVSYGVAFHVIQKHGEDLLYRYGNPALGDTCERVARDPQRKIAADDRLAAPLRRCIGLNMQPVFIATGLAAAVYAMEKDAENARKILENTCRLTDKEIGIVLDMYTAIAENPSLESLIGKISAEKSHLRGKNV